MNWLTRVIVALLRRSTALLPADRQVWARALWTEAYEVPEGWPRLAWLAGGTRWVVREAALGRSLLYPFAFAAAAAGAAWTAWSGPPGDAAIVINRVDVIAIAVILAGLPWVIRRTRGPVAAGRRAQLLRIGGYAAVLTLVVVKAAVERVADAPPNNQGSARAWTRRDCLPGRDDRLRGSDPDLYRSAVAGVSGHGRCRHSDRCRHGCPGVRAGAAWVPASLQRFVALAPV